MNIHRLIGFPFKPFFNGLLNAIGNKLFGSLNLLFKVFKFNKSLNVPENQKNKQFFDGLLTNFLIDYFHALFTMIDKRR